MPLWVKASGGTDFKPAPAGTHSAVCCDVVDLGMIEVTYNNKTKSQHKVKIVWQIEEDREDGKPFTVRKRYTLSLHEKAALRKDLEAWRGRAFTPAELEGFDLDVLIGISCMLNIIHAPALDGQVWANVAAIMKLPKSAPALTVRDYVRECDRDPKTQAQPGPEGVGISDEDIPF